MFFICDLLALIVLIIERSVHQANVQHNRQFQRRLRLTLSLYRNHDVLSMLSFVFTFSNQ